MSTAEIKTSLHKMIDAIEDNTILNAVYAILFKVTGKKVSSIALTKAEKIAVDKAIESVDKGILHSHNEVMEEMRKAHPDVIR